MIRIFILFLSFLFIASSSISSEKITYPIMQRNKRFKLKEVKASLKNLISKDSFEGKNFKIVQGKNNTAIKFTNKKLKLKAASVYFHLEKARDYFINNLSSEYIKNMPQITVRIEHTNKFNELGHFAHDNLDPQYNNALSVPSGQGYQAADIEAWGPEIWFRPAKKIHLSEIDQKASPISVKSLFRSFRKGLHMSTIQKFLMEYFKLDTYDGLSLNASVTQFIRTAGTSIILEISLSQSKFLESLFMRRWYKLDSALIPEIVYHEFAHIALGDHLKLNHSTSVVEGMADFFAGKIANSKELATKVKKYNSYNGKKVNYKENYRQEFELTGMANADFLFGLLWQIDETLNNEKLIYELRKKINADSNIRDNLIDGLFAVIKEDGNIAHSKVLKLYRILYNRGI